MTVQEAIADLKQDVDQLGSAHEMMQKNFEMLGRQLEIAKHNVEILQDAVVKGIAIPIASPHLAGRN